ncbi:MAG TPA: serine hydrolase [Candidatus Saccharimonadia bacterium]|nr:serine hydrolase [Candidatus Saccharimonadia bacterium]
MKYRRYVLLGVVGLSILGLGYAWAAMVGVNNAQTVSESAQHPLLARRVFADNPNDTIINFTSLRAALRERFGTETEPFSFYFEYLPTGTTIRINGESELIAASLVKLPLVMDLYHAVELGRIHLGDTAQLTADDLDASFGDLYKKGAGGSLTLQEAANLALTQSDNTAARLINRLTRGMLAANEQSLPALDIDHDTTKTGDAVISSRGYSSILKCLYLSCYLKPDSSQAILALMSKTAFTGRITKYTPKDVTVAHKIGVFNPANVHSDCGIFYVPKRPYLLCVMMQGDDAMVSQKMADTSKQIYDWVTSYSSVSTAR